MKIDKIKFGFVAIFIAAIGFIYLLLLNYIQYNNYAYNVWDLGQTFSLAYQFPIPNFSINPSEERKLIYLLYVPIVRIFPSPFTVIVIEDITFFATTMVLYLISVSLNISKKKGLLIILFYVFNYAFLGPIFDPGHYQYLFPLFFSLGYYFLSRRKPLFAMLFFSLSALASDLAAATVFLLGFLLVMELLFNRNDRYISGLTFYKKLTLGLGLLTITSTVILLGIYSFGGIVPFLFGGHINPIGYSTPTNGYATFIEAIQSNLILKVTFSLLILAPYLLYLPKSKYTVLIVPYFIILFLSSSFPYYGYFEFSYPYNIGAILFIIILDVEKNKSLEELEPIEKEKRKIKILSITKFKIFMHKYKFKFFLIVVVFINLISIPFSPINHLMPSWYNESPQSPNYNNFNLKDQLSYSEYDVYISSMIKMIPMNASVLVERNFPQLTNREGWQDPGYYNKNKTINYTLVDPYAPLSTFQNIEPWYNYFVKSGKYGVLSEEKGIILIKRSYHGKPIEFIPYSLNLTAEDFTNSIGIRGNQSFISSNNVTNFSDIFTNYQSKFLLPPGIYKITLNLSVSNISSKNKAIVLFHNNQNLTPVFTFNGSLFNRANIFQKVDFTISTGYFDNTWFVIRSDLNFNATLSLKSVSIQQISVPNLY